MTIMDNKLVDTNPVYPFYYSLYRQFTCDVFTAVARLWCIWHANNDKSVHAFYFGTLYAGIAETSLTVVIFISIRLSLLCWWLKEIVGGNLNLSLKSTLNKTLFHSAEQFKYKQIGPGGFRGSNAEILFLLILERRNVNNDQKSSFFIYIF